MGLLINRAKASCNAAGTGAVTPGSASPPYRAWAAAGATSGYYYDYLIEQNSGHAEEGVAFYNGTTLTRPGPGVDPWFESDTGSLLNVTTADTIACAANRWTLSAGGLLMPGPASAFTANVNGRSGSISVADTKDGILLNAGAFTNAGDCVRGYHMAVPGSTPWQIYAQLDSHLMESSFTYFGLYVKDNSGNKIVTHDYFYDNTTANPTGRTIASVSHWTDTTTFNAHVDSAVMPTREPWWSIKCDGTNLYFYSSPNPYDFQEVYREGQTAWLAAAPAFVGMFYSPFAGTPAKNGNAFVRAKYWSFNPPP